MHLSADVLGSSMDEFQNSWEDSIDMKPSYLYSRLTPIFNSHGLLGSNVSVDAYEKNKDTDPRIEGRCSV